MCLNNTRPLEQNQMNLLTHYFPQYDLTVREDGWFKIGMAMWTRGVRNSVTGYMTVPKCADKRPRTIYVHRLVANAFLPRPGPEMNEVDHMNGKRDQNSRHNLRWVTHALNCLNKFGVHNTLYKKRFKKYLARVTVNKHRYYLGWYVKQEQAALSAADFKELAFHFAYLQKATNDPSAAQGRRSYLHGDKNAFAMAIERLDTRVRKRPSLRKAVIALYNILSPQQQPPTALREKSVTC